MDHCSKKSDKNKRKLESADPSIEFHQVQLLTIDANHHERRVDNFLSSVLKLPKSRIYRMIRKGELRVNKKRVTPDYRLSKGDLLRIPPIYQEQRTDPYIPQAVITNLRNSSLFEDENLLIISKPSGIPVHTGSGLGFGVIECFKSLPEYKKGFIELAHRLDRETSGCLILGKNPVVLREINQLMKSNAMGKRYFALVKGIWKGGSRIIDAPLLKNTVRGGERMVQVHENGKSARTEFIPVAHYSDTTLLEVILHTGRTHQIRVHAAHMGMPIACDYKYGDEEFNKFMKKRGLRRLFLHASRLAFELASGHKIVADAPLPEDLQKVLRFLHA